MKLNRFYRDELSFLRLQGREFADAHPQLTRFLSEQSTDPDVERLLEGFAFLTGKLREKVEDEFPEITFRLVRYEASGQGAVTTGTLTILDSARGVRFPLSLTPSGSDVRIAGELALDMTDYGVEPPVVMLGLMRVRPQIRIEFSGIISP